MTLGLTLPTPVTPGHTSAIKILPFAPAWVYFMTHVLLRVGIVYSFLPFQIGILGSGALIIAMLPVYIVLVCAILIALLESIGAFNRWRRGEVILSKEEYEAMQKASAIKRDAAAAAAAAKGETEEEEAEESKKDA